MVVARSVAADDFLYDSFVGLVNSFGDFIGAKCMRRACHAVTLIKCEINVKYLVVPVFVPIRMARTVPFINLNIFIRVAQIVDMLRQTNESRLY